VGRPGCKVVTESAEILKFIVSKYDSEGKFTKTSNGAWDKLVGSDLGNEAEMTATDLALHGGKAPLSLPFFFARLEVAQKSS